jgi:aminoglycoside/choline kinase family phosphotransferase
MSARRDIDVVRAAPIESLGTNAVGDDTRASRATRASRTTHFARANRLLGALAHARDVGILARMGGVRLA